MKIMKINWLKLLLIVSIGFFGWLIFFSKSKENLLNSNNLVIGTNAEYYPYCFIKDSQIAGFDIELVLEISKRLGKNPIIKNMDFDMLIPEIQIGGVHLLAAGMTATDQRRKQVIFTEPYVKGVPLVIVTLKDKFLIKNGIKSLYGKKVAVNDGFTADLYLSNEKEIDLRRLATVTDAFLALNSGQVDAYVSAENALTDFFEKEGKEKFNISVIESTDENCALAISKHYPELLEKIQSILNNLEIDGTLDKLKKKWKLV